MKKLSGLLICMYAMIACVTAQEQYSKVNVSISSHAEVEKLCRLGIALEGPCTSQGTTVTLYLSAAELQRLATSGITYSVVIPDWLEYYHAQRKVDAPSLAKRSLQMPQSHFHSGSMGGSLTMAELLADLDSMHALYPGLVSARDSIGRTFENRPLWALRISARADSGALPGALYLATHHAREPASLMTVVYFMWYLLESYGTNPEVTSLVDNRELWFIPLVNPDGYCYNESQSPEGGGMWRMNRAPHAQDTLFGVDLNRNYGFQWGFDDIGSSPTPTFETYRGPAPFSELETQAVRRFAQQHNIVLANSLHSYAGYVFSPWNFSGRETDDSVLYGRLESNMVLFNKYKSGAGFRYRTNGDATDWLYGDTLSKPRIYALTTEVGADSDGFWPDWPRMQEIVAENLHGNLVLAHAAGSFPQIDRSGVTAQFNVDSMQLEIPFINGGIGEVPQSLDLTVSCPDLDFERTRIAGYRWQDQGKLTLVARKRKPVGSMVAIAIQIDYPGGTNLDTLNVRLGPASIVYADDAEFTRNRWIAMSTSSIKWDTTSLSAHSGRLSFAANPKIQYDDYYLESSLQLDSTLIFWGGFTEVRFWLKGVSQADMNCLRVEISSDRGATWNALAGTLTHPASGATGERPQGVPVIDGRINTWTEESMDISRFVGTKILLRFRYTSLTPVIAEDFLIDDIRILAYGSTSYARDGYVTPLLPARYSLGQNYPNPFNPSTTIKFELPKSSHVTLSVYDILGRQVSVLINERRDAGLHEVKFDAASLASGVYFYRLQAGSYVQTRKLLILK